MTIKNKQVEFVSSTGDEFERCLRKVQTFSKQHNVDCILYFNDFEYEINKHTNLLIILDNNISNGHAKISR